jgi:hypothetical protein
MKYSMLQADGQWISENGGTFLLSGSGIPNQKP